jgi:hypothetical protein
LFFRQGLTFLPGWPRPWSSYLLFLSIWYSLRLYHPEYTWSRLSIWYYRYVPLCLAFNHFKRKNIGRNKFKRTPLTLTLSCSWHTWWHMLSVPWLMMKRESSIHCFSVVKRPIITAFQYSEFFLI